MKRRIISLVLILVLGLLPIMAFAEKTEGDFGNVHWKVDKGTLYINGSGILDTAGPWDAYGNSIKKLDFSGTDLSIMCQFDYPNINEIKVGKGTVEIAHYAFPEIKSKKVKLIIEENNYQLDCQTYNSSRSGRFVTSVELGADIDNFVVEDDFVLNKTRDTLLMYFGKTEKTLDIPETVKNLSNNVLAGNQAQEIRLPQSLEYIGDGALGNSVNLTHLTIPGNVKTLGSGCFATCRKLKSLNFVNPVIAKYDEHAYDYYMLLDSIEDLIIPNYTDISNIYVDYNRSLTNIIVSEGNEILNGSECHLYSKDCDKLKSVFLPNSLKDISTQNLPYVSGVKLYVIEGSYSHEFAEQNGYSFEIVKPITDVILSKTEIKLKPKKKAELKAKIKPADATAKKVQWMSTNENVATVNNGKITAIRAGECDIIARGMDCGGISAICHVIVK